MAWKLSIKCNYFVHNNITHKINMCNRGKVSEDISYSWDSSSLIEAMKFWKHCSRLPGIAHFGSFSSGSLTSMTAFGIFVHRTQKWNQNETICKVSGTFLRGTTRNPYFSFILGITNWYSMCTALADGDAEGKA